MSVAAQAAAAFSTRLRQETHDQHDRIEANPRFKRLVADDITRAEYRALLGRIYGFHVVAEAAVKAAAGLLPPALALGRRLKRTAMLEADLRALGLTAAEIAALPRCGLPPLVTAEEAWGVLYLLEGSTVGGQILARHLAAVLGLTPANGAAGLAPYGTETGELWRGFKQALDETAAKGRLDQDAVVAVARHAFTALDEWVAAAS
jgi:heme oxygenase